MPTSLGPLPQPLGITRLQVASLVTSLVGANHSTINAELAQLGTVDVLVVCHKFLVYLCCGKRVHAHACFVVLNRALL